jgi:hypothetical protein
MKVTRTWTRITIAPAIAALALASCATQGDGTGGLSTGDFFSGNCNPLLLGGIGAAAGALLGGRDRRAAGAAIGASVGALACMAYNYQTRQTKSAQQVTEEYKAANNGAVPTVATVTRFNTQVSPQEAVHAGNAVVVVSQIDVVPGTNDPRPKVESQVALYEPGGKETLNARKPANEKPDGGGFETSFRFTLPDGVPQGVYPVKSQVLVNGQPAAASETRFQVVVGPAGTVVALAYAQ